MEKSKCSSMIGKPHSDTRVLIHSQICGVMRVVSGVMRVVSGVMRVVSGVNMPYTVGWGRGQRQEKGVFIFAASFGEKDQTIGSIF